MSFHLLNEEEAEGPEGVILAQGPCANLTMKSNNPPPVRRVAADHTVDAHTRAIRLRSIRVAEGDEVLITTRGNGILSVRAVRASRFSRAPLECSRHRSPVAAGWLRAEITAGPKRDFS